METQLPNENEETSNNEALLALVSASLEFIRATTEAYGIERGTAVWQTVSEAVGAEVRDAVTFSMLTGGRQAGVTIRQITDKNQVVPFIKCIRTHTALGLKDAKDAYDRAVNNGNEFIECPAKNRAKFASELRLLGSVVT